MKKRFLLMTTAIVTALFVSGQSVAVNAEEKPATESAEVITEEMKSVQNEEVKGKKEQSVEKQTEKEQPKKEERTLIMVRSLRVIQRIFTSSH